MKAQKYSRVLLFSGALLFALNTQAAANGKGKNSAGHPGGQAAAHMSNAGSVNNNAQWSADPTRGWVRADQRQKPSEASAPAKSNVVKPKLNPKVKARGY